MTPVRMQALRLGTLSLILGGLFGCSSLSLSFNIPVTNIRDIQQKSDVSSTVYIRGKVINQVPFLESRAYELQDSTGTIWVITEKKIPTPNKRLLIKGTVKQKNIRLGSKSLKEVYIEELQRL